MAKLLYIDKARWYSTRLAENTLPASQVAARTHAHAYTYTTKGVHFWISCWFSGNLQNIAIAGSHSGCFEIKLILLLISYKSHLQFFFHFLRFFSP